MGVPVFLQPAKPQAAALIRDMGLSNGRLTFQLVNTGNSHFLPSSVIVRGFTANGTAVGDWPINGWYVLAGERARLRADPGQAGVRSRPQPAGRNHGWRRGAQEPADDARRGVRQLNAEATRSRQSSIPWPNGSSPVSSHWRSWAARLRRRVRRSRPGTSQAVLDLTLNTASKGEIRVVLSGGDVWADVAALQRAGLVSLAGVRRTVGDRAYVRLSSMDPPMQVVVDEAALTLTLTADASLFGATTVRLDGGRPDGILYRRAPSAFLNYGATWATGGGQALNLESGLSVRGSLLTSSFFLRRWAGRREDSPRRSSTTPGG